MLDYDTGNRLPAGGLWKLAIYIQSSDILLLLFISLSGLLAEGKYHRITWATDTLLLDKTEKESRISGVS